MEWLGKCWSSFSISIYKSETLPKAKACKVLCLCESNVNPVNCSGTLRLLKELCAQYKDTNFWKNTFFGILNQHSYGTWCRKWCHSALCFFFFFAGRIDRAFNCCLWLQICSALPSELCAAAPSDTVSLTTNNSEQMSEKVMVMNIMSLLLSWNTLDFCSWTACYRINHGLKFLISATASKVIVSTQEKKI